MTPHPARPRYPWGQEAFDKARKENKPIFLSGNAPASPGMGVGGRVVADRGRGPPRKPEVRVSTVPSGPLGWHPSDQSLVPTAAPGPIPVGYSTCHWCHMMEEESFRNEEIGHLLNEDFVSVKVDREERPDVDKVYMTFVQVRGLPTAAGGYAGTGRGGGAFPSPSPSLHQATSSGGGWPMSVWLTPNLQPFVGGTYFPPEDGLTRVGFRTVLLRVRDQVGVNGGGGGRGQG